MLKINGIDIATPTGYDFGYEPIDKAERSSTGKMIIENIALKRKIQCTWDIITAAEQSIILGQTNASRFLTLEYLEPETNSLTTGTFYTAGVGQGATTLFSAGSLSHYKSFTVTFIQQ